MNAYKKRIMLYKSSLEIAREWLNKGWISKAEFKKCSAILAKRYDLDLCSLFVE